MRAPRTSTTVLALCHSRATSLYGFRMCSERSTPGSGSNISGSSLRSSPMAPISVRSVPRDMWTSSPCERILASTALISASPASGCITMIMVLSWPSSQSKTGGLSRAARPIPLVPVAALRSRAALGVHPIKVRKKPAVPAAGGIRRREPATSNLHATQSSTRSAQDRESRLPGGGNRRPAVQQKRNAPVLVTREDVRVK